jgi:hypothetical protein
MQIDRTRKNRNSVIHDSGTGLGRRECRNTSTDDVFFSACTFLKDTCKIDMITFARERVINHDNELDDMDSRFNL